MNAFLKSLQKFFKKEVFQILQRLWKVASFRSNPSEVFSGKDVRKLCSKFEGEHPCRSVISIKLLFLRAPLEDCFSSSCSVSLHCKVLTEATGALPENPSVK